MGRRYVNQLTDSRVTRYAVLWDLQWRVIDCATIAAGSDLESALHAALARLEREGWQPEGVPTYGFVFLVRNAERCLLMITARHPSEVNQAHFSPFRG